MRTNHPNRIRKQLANQDGILQKRSGDQHIDPQEESEATPRRAHRFSREDLQKVALPARERNESTS